MLTMSMDLGLKDSEEALNWYARYSWVWMAWSWMGEARRRKRQGERGLGDEERDWETENSRMEGRRGERRRAENQPRGKGEEGKEGRRWPEGEEKGREMKEVIVAIRVWEVEVVVVVVEEEASSSERVEGERRETWPKRRPSRGPEEEEKR
jgi:hypothetical protein